MAQGVTPETTTRYCSCFLEEGEGATVTHLTVAPSFKRHPILCPLRIGQRLTQGVVRDEIVVRPQSTDAPSPHALLSIRARLSPPNLTRSHEAVSILWNLFGVLLALDCCYQHAL